MRNPTVQKQRKVLLLPAVVAAFILAIFAFSFWAQPAQAAGETADADISITPRGPTLFNNAFSAANLKIETAIVPEDPLPPTITPMKVADLGLPASPRFTFRPKASMPVCADDQLGGPPTNVSVPVKTMIERCPQSLLGNGSAKFALGQSTSPLATRDGEILVFNGGRVNGKPKLKIYAYSYDTSTGIYTSAILQPNGQLRFEIPVLTADSAVRSLNLNIPGKRVVIEKPLLDLTVVLPAGSDSNYAQAKCTSGGFPWTADFTLGKRDLAGNPIGPPAFVVSDAGNYPCTGVKASARIAVPRVSGPRVVKRNRLATFRVLIRNTGQAPLLGARMVTSSRGIRVNTMIGRLNPGAAKTVRVRVKFRHPGRQRLVIRVARQGAGNETAVKFVRVRR